MTLEWIDIGHLADIAPRGARCVQTPQGKVGVFRTADDQVFALDNRCPHRGGPLTEGIVHGHSVTCPLHNWVIALDTGEAQGADDGQTRRWPVRVVDDRILLGVLVTGDIEASDGAPETATATTLAATLP